MSSIPILFKTKMFLMVKILQLARHNVYKLALCYIQTLPKPLHIPYIIIMCRETDNEQLEERVDGMEIYKTRQISQKE